MCRRESRDLPAIAASMFRPRVTSLVSESWSGSVGRSIVTVIGRHMGQARIAAGQVGRPVRATRVRTT